MGRNRKRRGAPPAIRTEKEWGPEVEEEIASQKLRALDRELNRGKWAPTDYYGSPILRETAVLLRYGIAWRMQGVVLDDIKRERMPCCYIGWWGPYCDLIKGVVDGMEVLDVDLRLRLSSGPDVVLFGGVTLHPNFLREEMAVLDDLRAAWGEVGHFGDPDDFFDHFNSEKKYRLAFQRNVELGNTAVTKISKFLDRNRNDLPASERIGALDAAIIRWCMTYPKLQEEATLRGIPLPKLPSPARPPK